MHTLPIYQIDAFGRGVFTGNPAAIVQLETWLPDETLLSIAQENNLSETAFILGDGAHWELRWFTPTTEVALCGHATLAGAHAVAQHISPGINAMTFQTRYSGQLQVRYEDGLYHMEFPAIQTHPRAITPELIAALDAEPRLASLGHYAPNEADILAVFDTEDEIKSLDPNFNAFHALGSRGVIATARADHISGRECDFVSRYFCPACGINEDPVTGSAHSLLTPYWAEQFKKPILKAEQLSARHGWLSVQLSGERIIISGQAHSYMSGKIKTY